MTVSELIKRLGEMPVDAEVVYLWDGGARGGVEFVWESRGGRVVTADFGEVCYDDEDRPLDAPWAGDRYWGTPERISLMR